MTTNDPLQGVPLLVAFSGEMVTLFRNFLGKGPERCKTYWAGSDMPVVLLGGGFTGAEQTLFEAGRGEAVRAQRVALSETLAQRMTLTVEALTRRPVIAVMSASHQRPDLSAQIFVLEAKDHSGRNSATGVSAS